MLKVKAVPEGRWHWVAVGVIAFTAMAVRLYYVHTAMVDHPLRGDTRQYFAYALNLIDHHVFSMVPPGGGVPSPDAFRDPGYPAFLALIISLFGREQGFYLATLDIQATLSALTVMFYALLAHRWFGIRAALVVGLGMAFWPHTITLSGLVLSETLVGFLVASGLFVLDIALKRPSTTGAVVAGCTFSMAALTNATLAPAIPLFALVATFRDPGRRMFWVALLIAASLPLGAWSVRSAHLPPERTAGDRVAMNFIQGSWPEYHEAWVAAMKTGNSSASATMATIDGEYALWHSDRAAGIQTVYARLSASPMRYLAWYASKPAELWGWSIGIGDGDIYVFPTFNSPLSSYGPLRVTTDLAFLVNPLLLALATAGALMVLVTSQRYPAALLAGTTIIITITLVFSVLQADARYATPYRGIEWILAALAARNIPALIRRPRA